MDELEEQVRDEALEECEQQRAYELDYERRERLARTPHCAEGMAT